MVIFSILLLISRLIPAFQLTDSSNVVAENLEEHKTSEEEMKLRMSREQSMREYVQLIKAYSQSGTYFVRKISAQSLLPIMRFDEYVPEIVSCFESL